MKKTIKVLETKVLKLNEGNDGKLQGGYMSLKGGFNAIKSGTNEDHCTNIIQCNASTNTTIVCINPATCFI